MNMEPINKAQEAPRVTQAEVTKWETDFREKVSPLVKFDVQDNNYSMKFYNGASGVDAYWSGTIILKADNYLKWNYSMLNGVFMEAKMNLDEDNFKLPSNLYDFFKAWQAEVSQTITEPEAETQAQNQETSMTTQPNAALAGPESANVPPTAPEGQPLAENLIIIKQIPKSRKETIMDSGERMRRLAGL